MGIPADFAGCFYWSVMIGEIWISEIKGAKTLSNVLSSSQCKAASCFACKQALISDQPTFQYWSGPAKSYFEEHCDWSRSAVGDSQEPPGYANDCVSVVCTLQWKDASVKMLHHHALQWSDRTCGQAKTADKTAETSFKIIRMIDVLWQNGAVQCKISFPSGHQKQTSFSPTRLISRLFSWRHELSLTTYFRLALDFTIYLADSF